MKKILQYMMNKSVRMQLLGIFVAMGIALGSVTLVSLSLNYKMMTKHGQYLEYIALLGKLSEVDDEGKATINAQLGQVEPGATEQIVAIASKGQALIEEIRQQTVSADINLRLRVAQYFYWEYERKGSQLVEQLMVGSPEAKGLSEASPYYALYLETIESLNRVDAYIQEMITYSVKENKAFLQEASWNSRVVQYILLSLVTAVLILVTYMGHRYGKYLEGLIGNILGLTKRIADGRKAEVLQVQQGPREVREIITSFNELILTMEGLRQRADEKAQLELQLAEEALEKTRMQALLKEAQIQGLQFQIQPHFLFNTLNVISMLAVMENNRKVYDLIMALSKFMRYSLRHTAHLVPIEEEVEMVSWYLYILKMRMGDQLEYSLQNELARSFEIPPFTLQPIVENAFRHGVEDKVGKGEIRVGIKGQKEDVLLRVYNNGTGMSPEVLEALREKCKSPYPSMDKDTHIGIQNVVDRLNMLFASRVTYEIYSNATRGTLFTIRIRMEGERMDV